MHFLPYDLPNGGNTVPEVWVAFDYGDGGQTGTGELLPGTANQALAQYILDRAITVTEDSEQNKKTYQLNAPIRAQMLVGKALLELCPGLEENEAFQIIGQPRDSKPYIDSWTVANDARETTPWARIGSKELDEDQAQRVWRGLPAGRVAVVAVAQHVSRAKWQTQRAFWTSAEVYAAPELPKVYAGAESTQAWTTRPFAFSPNPKKSWWLYEALARPLCWINGGEPSIDNVKKLPGLLFGAAKKRLGL